MASNRGVAYIRPEVVEVQSIDYPKRCSGSGSVNTG